MTVVNWWQVEGASNVWKWVWICQKKTVSWMWTNVTVGFTWVSVSSLFHGDSKFNWTPDSWAPPYSKAQTKTGSLWHHHGRLRSRHKSKWSSDCRHVGSAGLRANSKTSVCSKENCTESFDGEFLLWFFSKHTSGRLSVLQSSFSKTTPALAFILTFLFVSFINCSLILGVCILTIESESCSIR